MKRIPIYLIMSLFSVSCFAITSTGTRSASTSSLSSMGSNGLFSFGILGGIVNSFQDDVNQLVSRANTRAGGITTTQLTQAYEIAVPLEYRFAGSIYAFQLRPSYFYEVENGQNGGNTYNYSIKGPTIFPIIKMYPLENEMMKFYLQAGVGYGQLYGEIDEAGAVARFSSGAFGSLLGLGAQFYITQNSCISLEANYRYLTFSRSVVTDSVGTFAANSLSQYGQGQELELDSNDMAARMGGLMFLAGYQFWF